MELHPYAQAFAKCDHSGTVDLLAEDGSTAALFEIVYREVREIEYTHGFGDDQAAVIVAIAEGIGSGVARREVPSRARMFEFAIKPLVALAAASDRIGSRLVASMNRSAR